MIEVVLFLFEITLLDTSSFLLNRRVAIIFGLTSMFDFEIYINKGKNIFLALFCPL